MSSIPEPGTTVWYVPKKGQRESPTMTLHDCVSGTVESATAVWTKIVGVDGHQYTSRLYFSERAIINEAIKRYERQIRFIERHVKELREALLKLDD